MRLPVGPIVRSIIRRRVAFASIVLEVAFDLTVVLLSFVLTEWFIAQRREEMEIDGRELFVVESEPLELPATAPAERGAVQAERAAVRAIEGVELVTWLERPPFVMPRNFDVLTTSSGASRFAWLQEGGPEMVSAFGLDVFAGAEGELGPGTQDEGAGGGPVLLSESLARELFGHPSMAIGQRLASRMVREREVTGVFRDLVFVSAAAMDNRVTFVALGPEPPRAGRRVSLVRVAPEAQVDFPARARQALEPLGLWTRIESVRTYRERDDRPWFAGTVIPLVVVAVMLGSALIGTFGMAAYAVAQRTRFIGIRRALGASPADIVVHVLFEAWIMTTVGLVLGVFMAHGLLAVARRYEPGLQLEWPIVVLGVLVFWITGLVAAFIPALQASRIPPVAAARSA